MNECWNTTQYRAQEFLNTNLPTGTEMGWYTNKMDEANITASRYPIVASWLVLPGRRLTACLIDLPEIYKNDILVISAHFKCCEEGDYTRQKEADAFISFILDAKTPGGEIDLSANTPFVLMGDLNLVGLSQQLITLLYGDIQNTNIFGPGALPDWDDSNLEDLISRQTDKRMAYTWRNDWGSYPPGRLDYMIYSNSVMEVDKAFTLQTEVMSEERLDLYGLLESDTRTSSDHFPKVADFVIEKSMDIETVSTPAFKIEIFPNPAIEKISIQSDKIINTLEVYDLAGQLISTQLVNSKFLQYNTSYLIQGVYILKLFTNEGIKTQQLIIK